MNKDTILELLGEIRDYIDEELFEEDDEEHEEPLNKFKLEVRNNGIYLCYNNSTVINFHESGVYYRATHVSSQGAFALTPGMQQIRRNTIYAPHHVASTLSITFNEEEKEEVWCESIGRNCTRYTDRCAYRHIKHYAEKLMELWDDDAKNTSEYAELLKKLRDTANNIGKPQQPIRNFGILGEVSGKVELDLYQTNNSCDIWMRYQSATGIYRRTRLMEITREGYKPCILNKATLPDFIKLNEYNEILEWSY